MVNGFQGGRPQLSIFGGADPDELRPRDQCVEYFFEATQVCVEVWHCSHKIYRDRRDAVKIWERLKARDPSYRQGYVSTPCMGCAGHSLIWHTDQWIKSSDRDFILCAECSDMHRPALFKVVKPECLECRRPGFMLIEEFLEIGAEYTCKSCQEKK